MELNSTGKTPQQRRNRLFSRMQGLFGSRSQAVGHVDRRHDSPSDERTSVCRHSSADEKSAPPAYPNDCTFSEREKALERREKLLDDLAEVLVRLPDETRSLANQIQSLSDATRPVPAATLEVSAATSKLADAVGDLPIFICRLRWTLSQLADAIPEMPAATNRLADAAEDVPIVARALVDSMRKLDETVKGKEKDSEGRESPLNLNMREAMVQTSANRLAKDWAELAEVTSTRTLDKAMPSLDNLANAWTQLARSIYIKTWGDPEAGEKALADLFDEEYTSADTATGLNQKMETLSQWNEVARATETRDHILGQREFLFCLRESALRKREEASEATERNLGERERILWQQFQLGIQEQGNAAGEQETIAAKKASNEMNDAIWDRLAGEWETAAVDRDRALAAREETVRERESVAEERECALTVRESSWWDRGMFVKEHQSKEGTGELEGSSRTVYQILASAGATRST